MSEAIVAKQKSFEKTLAKEENKGACVDGGRHSFQMVGERGYYKNDESGKQDTALVYNTAYCPGCAQTVELVIADRRPRKNANHS